ncbi:MAG: FecR family protein [Muribaculaceae bacterium]
MTTISNKNNIDEDLLKSIEDHIDEDVNSLIKNETINMGGRKIPCFDEYGVYSNILNSIEQNRKRQKKYILRWACVAAVTIFAIINGAYFATQYIEKENVSLREIYSPKGEKLVVLLTDGSRVWLNADSKLIYPEQFVGDERNVEIEGEAYFEVNKNPDCPFMVKVDNMKVKVTGTSFNISAYPEDKDIITTLDEGKIMIGEGSKNYYTYKSMKPGQVAVYDRESSQCIIKDSENYKELSCWKDDLLTFRNTSLNGVLNVLSRTFDVTFKVNNKDVAMFTYNFVCDANDLSNILDIMTSITPLSYKKVGTNQYEIN